jgi:hypothetical protein
MAAKNIRSIDYMFNGLYSFAPDGDLQVEKDKFVQKMHDIQVPGETINEIVVILAEGNANGKMSLRRLQTELDNLIN